jgi:hypothetical protein
MPIDSSIYFQNKGIDFGKVLDSYNQGIDNKVKMSDLAKKQKQEQKEQDANEAINSAYSKDANGNMVFDGKMAMSNLVNKNLGYRAFENQGKFNDYQLALEEQDPNSARSQFYKTTAQKYGVQVPEGMSAAQIKTLFDPAKTIEQDVRSQADLKNQRALLGAKAGYDAKNDERGLDIKKQLVEFENKFKGFTGENLPIDSKKIVNDLAAKNAGKLSIKNQIDSVVSGWDNLSESQQLAMGSQLLKTLNSPEGADAIGSEEANRLGAKLQYAMGNFTNSNPTQFGRDLKGFKEQAKNTAKFIGDAISKNQQIIDEKMGRKKTTKTIRMTDGKGGYFGVPESEYGEAIAAGASRAE